jgi:hypothetical protein
VRRSLRDATQRLTAGTNMSGGVDQHLQLASRRVPRRVDEERGEDGRSGDVVTVGSQPEVEQDRAEGTERPNKVGRCSEDAQGRP